MLLVFDIFVWHKLFVLLDLCKVSTRSKCDSTDTKQCFQSHTYIAEFSLNLKVTLEMTMFYCSVERNMNAFFILTHMLLVANLANTNDAKKLRND